MPHVSFSDTKGDLKLVSYSASASGRARATTVTIKLEIKSSIALGMLMDDLAAMRHPAPPTKSDPLALPAPGAERGAS